MSANRVFRSPRRPGISNLIGAIFFVLIVALSIATLTLMFTGSSAYIGGIHTTNEQQLQAVNSNVTVSGVAFGGQLASGVAMTGGSPGIPLNPSAPIPLLPISNMNFSGGMQGWYVSESYPTLVDGATVSNALVSNGSSYIELTKVPTINPVSFVLSVTNNAMPGSGDFIAKISLLVDTYFTTVSGGTCTSGCAGWNLPAITADAGGYLNNITLTAPPIAGLAPGSTATWTWSADVPQSAGTFYHTVVIYWYNTKAAPPKYLDYGIATVSTTIVSPLPFPNPPAPGVVLAPPAAAIIPGGLTAGYDSNAITCTSSSGPGCVYVNFEPNYGGQRLPAGDQLSAGAAFTTTFSLTLSQICQLRVTSPLGCSQICPSNCNMDASVSSSLDEAASVPNSLVYYHLLLVSPSGAVYTINPDGTDPTTENHFAPSGWQEQSAIVAPPSTFWVPGSYKLELVVNMTMPSGLPSELSMHFDDVGLALNLMTPPSGLGGSAFASGGFTMTFNNPLPTLTYNQVEELDLAVNMSVSGFPPQTLSNTYAYVYAAGVPVGSNGAGLTKWYEVGSVTFNVSATVNVEIPQPEATSFVNGAGQMSIVVDAISVGSGSDCQVFPVQPFCTLSVSGYAVAQTENTVQAKGQAVFTITNGEGASAIHLVSLFFSGPNGTLPKSPTVGSTNGLATFTINNWVTAGSAAVIYECFGAVPPCLAPQPPNTPMNFAWIPGQVYQVTVVSATGVSYSASFTAP